MTGESTASSSCSSLPAPSSSPAVPDVHDVAVVHDVVLAFQPQCAFGTRVGFRAGFQQLVPADGLGSDEVLLEVRVDRARRLLRAYAAGHGPGAALVLS